MKYAIPKDGLEQHVIVLGKTRRGKSSCIRAGFVEPLLDAGKPVCIIDPKGDWWGLKSSADGKSAGYPVVIFGGEHADVPINEHSGASVAELVATGNRPCIIDLGGWMVAPRTRFFIDFASNLFKHSQGMRWLVIDEVHNFAPQTGGFKNPDRNIMLHWANRLASEGLGRGINLIAASQRPQKVHKDFVTSMETLIAMGVIHPLDRTAIKDWIDGCGDPAIGKEIIASLGQLKRGEGWVWSPEIGYGPKHRYFKMFKTYDSFAPRKAKEKALKGWASVDLDQVRDKLAEAMAQSEANDPKALKKKIVELHKALQKANDGKAIQSDEKGRFDELCTERDQYRDAFDDVRGENDALKEHIAIIRKQHVGEIEYLQSQYHGLIKRVAEFTLPEMPTIVVSQKKLLDNAMPAIKRTSKIREMPLGGNGASPGKVTDFGERESLSGPQRRILDSLAWWESIGITQPANVMVATMASYSAKGAAFRNPKSSLNAAGFISYPSAGLVELTDTGRIVANFPDKMPTGADLRQGVLNRLNGPQKRILLPLIHHYPEAMDNAALAAAANYSPDGAAYRNPKSALRSLGLVEYPSSGRVMACDFLFPELS